MKTILTILTFIFTISLSAQVVSSKEIVYNVSAPYSTKGNANKPYFIQKDFIISPFFQKRDIVIQRFSTSTLRLVSTKIYTTSSKFPEASYNKTFHQFNEKLLIFYALEDEKTESEQIFYQEIDFSKGTLEGSGIPIIERKKGSKTVYPKIYFKQSLDGSKLLIVYEPYQEDEEAKQKYGLLVMDTNLEKVWSDEVSFPQFNGVMENGDFSINNAGSVFCMAKSHAGINNKQLKERNKSSETYLVKFHKGKIEKNRIDWTDKYYVFGEIKEDPTGAGFIYAGYFSEENNQYSDSPINFFYRKINAEGTVSEPVKHQFSDEIRDQYKIGKEKKVFTNPRKEGQVLTLPGLYFMEVILSEDGGLVFVGEQRYKYTKTGKTQSGQFYIQKYAMHNDLLLVKMDESGTFAWQQRLPKFQFVPEYRALMKNNSLMDIRTVNNNQYFLFFDNIDNKDKGLSEKPKLAHHIMGCLTAYKVSNKTGEVNKIAIVHTENVPELDSKGIYHLEIDEILNVSESEFIFGGYKKKKENAFMRFTIKP